MRSKPASLVLASVRSRSACAELADQTKEWIPMRDMIISACYSRPARAPAHLPEVGLEPGGFLEDRNQLCLAGRRGVEIGEMLQVRLCFHRNLLVWHAG